jgi:hypothetical protein
VRSASTRPRSTWSPDEPQVGQFHTLLHKLDLGTGQDLVAAGRDRGQRDDERRLDDPLQRPDQWIRSGLGYANGTIYIAASSHCDGNAGRDRGWLMRYGTDLTQQVGVQHHRDAGGLRARGDLDVGFRAGDRRRRQRLRHHGNGNFAKGGKDWGESVIKLPKTLARVNDFFTPRSLRSPERRRPRLRLALASCCCPSCRASRRRRWPSRWARTRLCTCWIAWRARRQEGQRRRRAAGDSACRVRGGGLWGGPAYFGGPDGGVGLLPAQLDSLRAFSVSTGSAAQARRRPPRARPRRLGRLAAHRVVQRREAGHGRRLGDPPRRHGCSSRPTTPSISAPRSVRRLGGLVAEGRAVPDAAAGEWPGLRAGDRHGIGSFGLTPVKRRPDSLQARTPRAMAAASRGIGNEQHRARSPRGAARPRASAADGAKPAVGLQRPASSG